VSLCQKNAASISLKRVSISFVPFANPSYKGLVEAGLIKDNFTSAFEGTQFLLEYNANKFLIPYSKYLESNDKKMEIKVKVCLRYVFGLLTNILLNDGMPIYIGNRMNVQKKPILESIFEIILSDASQTQSMEILKFICEEAKVNAYLNLDSDLLNRHVWYLNQRIKRARELHDDDQVGILMSKEGMANDTDMYMERLDIVTGYPFNPKYIVDVNIILPEHIRKFAENHDPAKGAKATPAKAATPAPAKATPSQISNMNRKSRKKAHKRNTRKL
jgi:hypothetical protein